MSTAEEQKARNTKGPIPLARPCFFEQELQAVARVLQSGHVTQGPEVAAFETELSAATGSRTAIAVSSGGSALLLSMVASGAGCGDEVIVPDFVFPAAAMGAMFLGATPVPADVDRDSLAVTPATVERRLSDRTRVVVVVHPFGIPADVEGVRAICPDSVTVIEDAACALGGLTARGAVAGTAARFGCFSFHPRKSITTGEGGCITAEGDDVESIRRLRDYGRGGRGFGDVFHSIGMNFRLSDLAAAVGRVQLNRMRASIETRQRLFERYDTNLSGVSGVRIPAAYRLPGNTFQSMVIEVGPRASDLVSMMAAAGVQSGPSAHALSQQSVFLKQFRHLAASCDGSGRDLAGSTIVLPMFDEMAPEDVDRVSDVLVECLRHLA